MIKKSIEYDLKDVIKKGEKGIYRYLFASNPKPYPISGLQHFLGTAFLALRLANYLKLREDRQIIAFLGGLFHDFEKMGLTKEQMLKKGIEGIIDPETSIYQAINRLFGEKVDYIWRSAIEVAFKLESGGVTGTYLQKLVPLIKVADHVTGGDESWNIMKIFEALIEEINISQENIIPIVLGRQRPLISMVSEKLEKHLEFMKIVPLVTAPTGSIFLTENTSTNISKSIRGIYLKIAEELLVSQQQTIKTAKPVKELSHKSLVNFLEKARRRQKVNVGALLSRVKTLRQLDENTIEVTIKKATKLTDMKYVILHLALIYAKTISEEKKKKATETLPIVLKELGINVGKKRFEEMLLETDEILSKMDIDSLRHILDVLNNKIKAYMKSIISSAGDIKILHKCLCKIISIGGVSCNHYIEEDMRLDGITCAVCRELISKNLAIPLKQYIQSLKRVFKKLNYAEIFHTDVQAAPNKSGSMEGLTDRLYVCPVCNYESITFPEQVGFIDGMWSSVLVYYPAISTDLLDIIKNVLREPGVVGYEKPLVIPDYITSKIIVKTSDPRGRLRREDLLRALDLWYYCGGSLVLTTNALSSTFVWSGMPIEIEKTDTVIEESVRSFMLELKLAKDREEWSRTRNLRRVLYKQLQTYVRNLDSFTDRRSGEVKLRKIRLIESLHPALDIYSFVLRKQS